MDGESAHAPEAHPSELPPLRPAWEAQMRRRVAVLLGLVPLAEMSQEEADWLFRQRTVMADAED